MMAGKVDHATQSEAIAKVLAVASLAPEVRSHLAEILQSPIFKASPRSQHLLQYVVEKALAGDFDLLKERLIGAEVFGRPAGYDTGEDAIVRVAASDVRKRLLQFYGTGGAPGRIRIDLPPGSYLPSFGLSETPVHEPVASAPAPEPRTPPVESPEHRPVAGDIRKRAPLSLILVVVLGIVFTISLVLRLYSAPAFVVVSLPWSALFPKAGPQTDIILSDTNISALQVLLDFRIPLSEYANRRYMPMSERPLSPDMQRVVRSLTGIDYTAPTAAIDAVTVLRVSEIAGAYSTRIKVRPARSAQLHDFESDDNFVLLGSPASNPWGALFADQLDFAFDYDNGLKTEFLRNNHPRPGELPRYIPTAPGGATGRTFGIIGFIRNPNHSGHILIIAGTTAEATEAGAELVTNQAAFSTLLHRNGISESGPPRHFEILLSVDAMAAAPAKSAIVAVHTLADLPSPR
jgi:hypothetical protein